MLRWVIIARRFSSNLGHYCTPVHSEENVIKIIDETTGTPIVSNAELPEDNQFGPASAIAYNPNTNRLWRVFGNESELRGVDLLNGSDFSRFNLFDSFNQYGAVTGYTALNIVDETFVVMTVNSERGNPTFIERQRRFFGSGNGISSAFNPNGNRFYSTDFVGLKVFSHTPEGNILLGEAGFSGASSPWHVVASENGMAYVTDLGLHSLWRVDGTNISVLGATPVGLQPLHAAVSDFGIYVSNAGDGTVTFISTRVVPTGTNITVQPSPTLALAIPNITTSDGYAASTTITSLTSTPPPVAGFQVPPTSPEYPTYLDIDITAATEGQTVMVTFPVRIMVAYNPNLFPYHPDGSTDAAKWPSGKPTILHYEEQDGAWGFYPLANLTVDPVTKTVSGDTYSFSPFAIARQPEILHRVQALYDQTKLHKSGSTVPIKIRVTDPAGANVSSASLSVQAITIRQLTASATGVLEDSGNANPDLNFRYDANLGGYIFNLKLNYPTGTYEMLIQVADDPAPYAVQFKVK